MEIKTFATEAIMPHNGIKTAADRGVKIQFETQELSAEQWESLVQLKGTHGKLVFAAEDAEITAEDIELPTESEGSKTKSPSQRLHDRMAVYYKKKHNTSIGFNVWYAETLDEIGQKYLDRINN